MTDDEILQQVPRERWAGTLATILLTGYQQHPDALAALVSEGEAKFVQVGMMTDRMGLTKSDYRHIFRKLARASKRWGVATVQ